MGSLAKSILHKLHRVDPYQGFDYQTYPFDLQGTGGHPIFAEILRAVCPTLVVEVGSWKGASAICLAELLRAHDVDGAVVCIDTWLGSLEHWDGRIAGWDVRPYCKHGYPTLYYQFLANVMHKGCQDLIVPLPNTSTMAARWLEQNQIRADLVYLDGSHDEEDVYCDLMNYWKLLSPGGVLFGDDWRWASVASAVSRFAREKGIEARLRVCENTWVLPKAAVEKSPGLAGAFGDAPRSTSAAADQATLLGGRIPGGQVLPMETSDERAATACCVAQGASTRPMISVIMPVHNGMATLDRALRSVQTQTLGDWELVAVDDASSDGSLEVLQRWASADARIRVVPLETNSGPAAARNAGVRAARGEWIAYLDHDDEFYPDYLGEVARHRDQGDVVVFGYDLVYDDGPAQGRATSWDPGAVRARLFEVNIVTPLGVAHRREWWEKAGGFDETWWRKEARWYEEDWDFWKRLARAGAQFAFLKMKSGRYHVRGDSFSRRPRPCAGELPEQAAEGGGQSPLISVVLPVHNGARLVERALRSVVQQTFGNWELVAVDDGSTDDTFPMLQRWEAADTRIKVVRLEENLGPGAARNAGLRSARGEWIAYLDHDDEYAPNHLEHVAQNRDQGEVLVFAYDIVLPDGVQSMSWNPAEGRGELFSAHIAMPMAVAHRREVVEKVDGFNELLWWEEDAEFWRRIARAGVKFAFLPYKSGRYHARPDSRRRAPRLTARQKEVLHRNWRAGRALYGEVPFGTARREIRRIAFASPYCLMDHTSGAAIATANGLRFLTQLGFECRAFCGSYLDSAGEGVEEMLAKQKTPCKVEVVEVRGRQASLVHTTPGAMPVTIFRSESTRGVWRDEAEVAAFLETYQRFLDEYRPDAVWTYGGDMAADLMVKRAKDRDIPVVFGLHNFGYWDIINFAPVDYVTVPSEFSRQHHWRKLGLACHKLPNVIDWDRVQARGSHGQGSTEQGAGGCVTFVNPQPTKGLFVFARIAEAMARCRPDIPLLVVEGRSHTAWRLETGIDLGGLPNVKTMPSTGDPREFYAMTKVILMPSLWNESFGLVAAEAMINGIPVLGSNRGALPETVGDGGILFDIPECYTPETRIVPTPGEVEAWVDTIIRLWDDKEFYAQATEKARQRAECWRPERLAPFYRDFFSNLVPQPSPPVVPKNSIDAGAEVAIARH